MFSKTQSQWIQLTNLKVLLLIIHFTKGRCSRKAANKAFVRTYSFDIHAADDLIVPGFSVHAEELAESTKKKLNDRGYFYANSNAGLGWTDRANRCVQHARGNQRAN